MESVRYKSSSSRRVKKAANYTLSKSARWYCRRLKKPMQQPSESAVAEALILKEAERLGLKKAEAPTLPGQSTQPQPEQPQEAV